MTQQNKLNLREIIGQIEGIKPGQTLSEIRIPAEIINITQPSSYQNFSPKIAYAILLGRYADRLNYSSSELLELHNGMQTIALNRLSDSSVMESEAMILCENGFLYQNVLGNILKRSMKSAKGDDLANLIDMYTSQLKGFADAQAGRNQKRFLHSQIEAFEDNYLNKTGSSSSDHYLVRYQAMLDYIGAHGLTDATRGHMSSMMGRLRERMVIDASDGESSLTMTRLGSIVQEWTRTYHGTVAEPFVKELERYVPKPADNPIRHRTGLKTVLSFF